MGESRFNEHENYWEAVLLISSQSSNVNTGNKRIQASVLEKIYNGQNISVKLSFIRGFESQDHYYFFKDPKCNYVNALIVHICCFSCSVHLLPFFRIRTLIYLWRESPLIPSLTVSRVQLTSLLGSLGWVWDPDLVKLSILPCFVPLPHILGIYSGVGHKPSKASPCCSQAMSSICWGEVLTSPWED